MLIIYHVTIRNLVPLDTLSIKQYTERAAVYNLHLRAYFIWLTPSAILGTLFLISFETIRQIIASLLIRWRKIPGWFFWGVIPVLFTGLSACTALWVLGGVPRIFDGFNYHFQARNFALGQFFASVPPLPELFRFPFIILNESKWYGSVYPGYSLFLAIGFRLGVDWLVNPIAGGIALVLIYFTSRDMLNESSARVASILGLCSPFFRMMNSIFMAHATAIVWVTLALWMGWRWMKKGVDASLLEPLLASIAIGWLYITRPQAGAVALTPLYAVVLWRVRSKSWKHLVAFLIPLFCFVVVLGIYNQKVTGDFRVNPRYFVDPERRLGFGDDLGEPLPGGGRSGHDLARGVRNVEILLRLWNAEMFGWGSFGAMGWMTLILVITIILEKQNPLNWVLFLSILFNTILYMFYFTPSPNFGPRYFAEVIPASLILFVSGLRLVSGMLPISWTCRGQPVGLAVLLAIMLSLSITIFVPLHNLYYGLLPPVLQRSQVPEPEEASIIVVAKDLYCMNIYTWNSPDLSGNIFLPSVDTVSIERIKKEFPHRVVYRLVKTGPLGNNLELIRADDSARHLL
ncbi:glycosyltransferase family 39 protein [bacterium]|nr:glycosyltransferase family 39 protein [candidate division CSSED10-310 bacterium]